MPKALTQSDGEHSDRESQARVQTRSVQGKSLWKGRESLKTVADSGIVASDPPAEEPEIESYRSPQGRVLRAG